MEIPMHMQDELIKVQKDTQGFLLPKVGFEPTSCFTGAVSLDPQT